MKLNFEKKILEDQQIWDLKEFWYKKYKRHHAQGIEDI